MTIEGARRRLKEKRTSEAASNLNIRDIKEELEDILQLLNASG
jgi:hypothetical protein